MLDILGDGTSIYQPKQSGLIFPERPAFASVTEERDYCKRHLVAACRAFAIHGFDYGFAGHLTVRRARCSQSIKIDWGWVQHRSGTFVHSRRVMHGEVVNETLLRTFGGAPEGRNLAGGQRSGGRDRSRTRSASVNDPPRTTTSRA